jgi:alpha-tubulin suppressor-like RCC1 family protein
LNGKKIIQIAAGYQHTCAIANDLNSYCWGGNLFIFNSKKKFNFNEKKTKKKKYFFNNF